MAVVRIRSLADAEAHPLVAEYRGVRDPELLARGGLFVAEGRAVVRRLLEQRRYPVRSVLVNDAAFAALEAALPGFPPEHLPVFVAPLDDFRSISGLNIHRGCLAVGVRTPPPALAELLQPASLVVVLERVANADNVGGVFRNAAAFGAGAVLLDPATCDPLYRKAIRTSAAASLSVPFARVTPWPEALDELRAAGFTLLALTPRADAVPIERIAGAEPPARTALLLGSEGDGLSEAALSRAGVHVRIPMRAGVDSLNVAVAAGIALSRLSRMTDS